MSFTETQRLSIVSRIDDLEDMLDDLARSNAADQVDRVTLKSYALFSNLREIFAPGEEV